MHGAQSSELSRLEVNLNQGPDQYRERGGASLINHFYFFFLFIFF
jgi:hypothetical protein